MNSNDWNQISKRPQMTVDEFEQHSRFLKWPLVTTYSKNLTLEFIRNNLGYFNKSWDEISRYQTLSESVMEEFSDLINWPLVSRYQKMSEDFINKHKFLVHWDNIEKYQNVSKDFLE